MRTAAALVVDPNRRTTNPRWSAMTYVERFWSHVDKTGECWLWTGSRNHRGYGSVGLGGKRSELAHRVSWSIAFGAIPARALVLHKTHCTSKACVRPDHLYLGDQKQNMRDANAVGVLKGRNVARGENAGPARLTTEQALEIIARSRRGESYGAIAADSGVTPNQVYRIATGRQWAHLSRQLSRMSAPGGAA